MYVYETEFPIDYFSGMTALKDYIILCFKNQNDPYAYLTYIELQKFLVSSFMAVKCAVTNWEGDIRSDNIFMSAIPYLDNTTKKLLAFKQDNNGSSFIASEFQLPLPVKDQQFQLMKLHDLNSQSMMVYFEESFILTCNIIDKATKEMKQIAKIIKLEDINNLLDKEEDKSPPKDNKFDMKNYEKI